MTLKTSPAILFMEVEMKKILILLLVLLTVCAFSFAEGVKEESENVVTVYAYDSFAGDWGPGAEVIPAFEEATGIKVNLVSAGDAGEMLSRIIMEGDDCPADGGFCLLSGDRPLFG